MNECCAAMYILSPTRHTNITTHTSRGVPLHPVDATFQLFLIQHHTSVNTHTKHSLLGDPTLTASAPSKKLQGNTAYSLQCQDLTTIFRILVAAYWAGYHDFGPEDDQRCTESIKQDVISKRGHWLAPSLTEERFASSLLPQCCSPVRGHWGVAQHAKAGQHTILRKFCTWPLVEAISYHCSERRPEEGLSPHTLEAP